jgi:hypothetical protein
MNNESFSAIEKAPSRSIDITSPTILIGSDIFFDIDKLEDLLHKELVGKFGTFNLFVGLISYA